MFGGEGRDMLGGGEGRVYVGRVARARALQNIAVYKFYLRPNAKPSHMSSTHRAYWLDSIPHAI